MIALLASLHTGAHEVEESAGAMPYLVGAGVLVILLILLAALLVFGKGREHS